MNYQKWILMICWPILMISGIWFMVNFTYETLGFLGFVMIVFGFFSASWFIFADVKSE